MQLQITLYIQAIFLVRIYSTPLLIQNQSFLAQKNNLKKLSAHWNKSKLQKSQVRHKCNLNIQFIFAKRTSEHEWVLLHFMNMNSILITLFGSDPGWIQLSGVYFQLCFSELIYKISFNFSIIEISC